MPFYFFPVFTSYHFLAVLSSPILFKWPNHLSCFSSILFSIVYASTDCLISLFCILSTIDFPSAFSHISSLLIILLCFFLVVIYESDPYVSIGMDTFLYTYILVYFCLYCIFNTMIRSSCSGLFFYLILHT